MKKYDSLTEEIKKNIKELSDLKTKNKEEEIKLIQKFLINKRKKISSIIFSLDKRKNLITVKILLLNKKNEELLNLKNLKKDPSELKKNILEFESKLNSSKENILKLKSQNKNYEFEVFESFNHKKSLNQNKKLLNKIENLTFEKIELKEQKIANDLKLNQNKLDEFNNELEFVLNLINEIDEIFKKKKPQDVGNYAFVVNGLNVFYGSKQSLFDVNLKIPKNKVISIIGPSGCGKSTFLKTLNRINDEIPVFKAKGEILLEGEYDIYKLKSIINENDKIEITNLRTKVGMIFQQPNPFPMSIYKNVAFGPKINGIKNKKYLDEVVETSLKDAALWDEVSYNLNAIGTSLSGGQQQRLCIARAIANKPQILLMDEPTSALDPIAAAKIEDLILKLKKNYTIIIVTHSMQQAARISDYTAFFYEGKLIEFDRTSKLFSTPKEKRTDDYIRGKFG